MIQIVDTHAHLESLENIEKVLGEARLKGVAAIVAMGSDYQSDVKTLELAAKFKGYVFPAVGLHPWELGRSQAGELERVLKLIEENNEDIVAIGEIGLDYHKSVKAEASKDRQQAVLKELLLLSRKLGKPVSLHSRYAWKDCLSCVREAAVDKAVFHWFTGFSSVLQGIISAGYYISVTPAAEYHAEHRRAIKEAPLERLLLETDCPVYYGREDRYQSSPVDLRRSLTAAAQIKETDEENIALHTTKNAMKLFNLVL